MANKMKKGLLTKVTESISTHLRINNFHIKRRENSTITTKVKFAVWGKYDENHRVVRFATSWATTEENVNQLLELI